MKYLLDNIFLVGIKWMWVFRSVLEIRNVDVYIF